MSRGPDQIAEDQRRKDLYFAMRTRPLSDEELEEVKKFGRFIAVGSFVDSGGYIMYDGYKPNELELIFNDALFKQARLRMIAAGIKWPDGL